LRRLRSCWIDGVSRGENSQPALVAAMLALAIALRLWALGPFSMHHPDEIFQYLEPAHRIAFGSGVETWEFRQGMRGWLIPVVLSKLMLVGNLIAPDSRLYLLLPHLAVAALSLTIPCSAYAIGYRLSRAHAPVALAVTSIWFEAVYFSVHVLSEQISVALFLPAAALMLADRQHDRRRHALAGLLLGLAVATRFHNGPAIGAFAVMTCGTDVRRKWLPLVLGAGIAGVAAAAADLSQSMTPFSWIVANVEQNVVQGQAATFGLRSPVFYLGALGVYWGWALPLLLLAIRPAVARHRALFVAALVNVALLSMIGHKEYRFILLSTTLLLLLAALGSVDLVRAWNAKRGRSTPTIAWVALVLAWATGSAALAANANMRPRWTDHSSELTLMAEAARLPSLCGLALHKQAFWQSGGYTHLHRAVPLYVQYPAFQPGGDTRFWASAAAFDAVITPDSASPAVPGSYRITACRGTGGERMCLMRRSGGCRADAARDLALPAVMRRHRL
jgi:hypothetical protein